MTTSILAFVLATVVIVVVGPRLARIAEEIADRSGIGQVLIGAVLLGVVTSLPGLVLTTTAAARGDVDLAVANALGGVAAQTFFLAIADIVYRSGTMSSGVPTQDVAFQAAMLTVLLSLVVLGLGSSDLAWGRVHPASVGIVVAYAAGLHLSRRIDAGRSEADVEGARGGLRGKLGELEEAPESHEEEVLSGRGLAVRFAAFAVLLVSAGFVLALAGSDLADRTALSAASVGVLLTAVATSTPELVTAVAAARRGAIGLAAGDIIGGNTFDTLFVAAADFASDVPVFAAAGGAAIGLVGLVILLDGTLLAGLVRRGTQGAKAVGVESIVIVVVWVVSVVVLVVGS